MHKGQQSRAVERVEKWWKKCVQTGWNWWRKSSGLLCEGKVPAGMGKVWKILVKPAMLCGFEMAQLKSRQEAEMEGFLWE